MTRHRGRGDFPPVPTSNVPSAEEARRAKEDSQRRFRETIENGLEVRRLAHEMVRLRQNNHFARDIDRSMTKRWF